MQSVGQKKTKTLRKRCNATITRVLSQLMLQLQECSANYKIIYIYINIELKAFNNCQFLAFVIIKYGLRYIWSPSHTKHCIRNYTHTHTHIYIWPSFNQILYLWHTPDFSLHLTWTEFKTGIWISFSSFIKSRKNMFSSGFSSSRVRLSTFWIIHLSI